MWSRTLWAVRVAPARWIRITATSIPVTPVGHPIGAGLQSACEPGFDSFQDATVNDPTRLDHCRENRGFSTFETRRTTRREFQRNTPIEMRHFSCRRHSSGPHSRTRPTRDFRVARNNVLFWYSWVHGYHCNRKCHANPVQFIAGPNCRVSSI